MQSMKPAEKLNGNMRPGESDGLQRSICTEWSRPPRLCPIRLIFICRRRLSPEDWFILDRVIRTCTRWTPGAERCNGNSEPATSYIPLRRLPMVHFSSGVGIRIFTRWTPQMERRNGVSKPVKTTKPIIKPEFKLHRQLLTASFIWDAETQIFTQSMQGPGKSSGPTIIKDPG